MADLRELYQETILDHNKRPRNFHEIPNADATAVGHNPLCGDRVTVYLRLADDRIADVAFVTMSFASGIIAACSIARSMLSHSTR